MPTKHEDAFAEEAETRATVRKQTLEYWRQVWRTISSRLSGGVERLFAHPVCSIDTLYLRGTALTHLTRTPTKWKSGAIFGISEKLRRCLIARRRDLLLLRIGET